MTSVRAALLRRPQPRPLLRPRPPLRQARGHPLHGNHSFQVERNPIDPVSLVIVMPKMLAVPSVDKFAILIRDQRKLYQREEEEIVKEVTKEDDDARQREEKLKEHQAAAKRLDNALLVLRRFISEGNELHTPVTKDEIVSEVARQLNINIHPDNLHLLSPLSSLGEFELPLRLPRDIPRQKASYNGPSRLRL